MGMGSRMQPQRQGAPQSAFPQQMGGKGGGMQNMQQPTQNPMQPPGQPPQPMGGKGGGMAAEPGVLKPMQPLMHAGFAMQDPTAQRLGVYDASQFGQANPLGMSNYDSPQNAQLAMQDQMRQLPQPMQQPQPMGGKGNLQNAINPRQLQMRQMAMRQSPMNRYQNPNALSGLAALAQRRGMM